MLLTGLCVALLVVAAATDVARHKIYNWTTYPGMLAALAINAAGICWHAGVGSWRFPDGVSVPTNSGNYWLYGAEKANNGLGESMNDAFHYATDALFRAVLERCG